MLCRYATNKNPQNPLNPMINRLMNLTLAKFNPKPKILTNVSFKRLSFKN